MFERVMSIADLNLSPGCLIRLGNWHPFLTSKAIVQIIYSCPGFLALITIRSIVFQLNPLNDGSGKVLPPGLHKKSTSNVPGAG